MNRGIIAILLATTIFGSAGVFVKTLEVPITVIACLRVLLPTCIILLFFHDVRRKLIHSPNKLLLGVSLITTVRVLLWVLGFLYASISKAIVMLYTWPIFFCLFGAVFLGEKVSRRSKFLLLLAFAGIVIIYSAEELSFANKELLGMGLMLIVAIMNATVTTILKHQLNTYSQYDAVLYDNLIGAVVFTPFLLIHFGDISATELAIGSLYGFLIGFLGYSLLYYGLSQLKASVAAVLGYWEVLSACAFGVLFFGDVITWQMLVGGSMIVVTTALVRMENPPK